MKCHFLWFTVYVLSYDCCCLDQWRIQDCAKGVRFRQEHGNAVGVKGRDTPPSKKWKI